MSEGCEEINIEFQTSKGKRQQHEEHPPWADLFESLLHLILSHLRFPDYIRFAGVCSSWRSAQRACRVGPSGAAGHFPWLVTSNKPIHSSDTYTFTSRYGTLRIPIPGTSGFALLLCSHGWLFSSSYSSNGALFLLNPVSNARIDLPSWDPRDIRICPIVLTAAPTEPNCLILMLREKTLVFCRPGSPIWSVLYIPQRTIHCACDMFPCSGNVVYIQDRQVRSKFWVADLSGTSPRVINSPFTVDEDHCLREWLGASGAMSKFFVESWGEILMVLVHMQPVNIARYFLVHRMDVERRRWVWVQSLDDRILFLGGRYGSSSGVSVPAAAAGSRGNTIYLAIQSCSCEYGAAQYNCRYDLYQGPILMRVIPHGGWWLLPHIQ